MEERLKQRLIGGAVLVSLVVIFVPMLLEEQVVSDRNFSETRIPEKPQALQQRLESQSILPPPIPQAQPIQQPAEITEPVKVDELPRIGKIERSTPTAWMVQVASFSKQDNAKKLVDRLQDAGMPAQLNEVMINGKRHFRVQMRPQLNKKQAEELVDRIKKEFELEANIVRYAG